VVWNRNLPEVRQCLTIKHSHPLLHNISDVKGN